MGQIKIDELDIEVVDSKDIDPKTIWADEPKTLTTGQVAEALGVNEQTLRYFADKFADMLGFSDKEAGKHRRYTPEAVRILSNIVELYNQGMTPAKIKEHMLNQKGELTQQSAAINKIVNEITVLSNNSASIQQFILAEKKHRDEKDAEILSKINALQLSFEDTLQKKDKEIQELQEKLKQAEEKANTPLLKRIFGKN